MQEMLAGRTLVIPGSSFTLKLNVFLSTRTSFGFRVTAVEPMTQAQYDAYLADVAYSA